jgi:hypothetical protein
MPLWGWGRRGGRARAGCGKGSGGGSWSVCDGSAAPKRHQPRTEPMLEQGGMWFLQTSRISSSLGAILNARVEVQLLHAPHPQLCGVPCTGAMHWLPGVWWVEHERDVSQSPFEIRTFLIFSSREKRGQKGGYEEVLTTVDCHVVKLSVEGALPPIRDLLRSGRLRCSISPLARTRRDVT